MMGLLDTIDVNVNCVGVFDSRLPQICPVDDEFFPFNSLDVRVALPILRFVLRVDLHGLSIDLDPSEAVAEEGGSLKR